MKQKKNPLKNLLKNRANILRSTLRNIVALCVFAWPFLGFSLDKLTVIVDSASETFEVSLPANPTTGFQWVVDSYDKNHFILLSRHYASQGMKRIGSGGKMLFVFGPKEGIPYPPATRMTFRYERSWEPESATVTQVKIVFKRLDSRPIKP